MTRSLKFFKNIDIGKVSVSVSTSCKGEIGRIIHSEWTRQSWKPDRLVDEFTMFMMLKHMMGKALTQPVWLLCMKYQMDWSTVLFEHSLDLSFWGWYVDDIFSLTPVNSFSIFQKHQRKSLLWSLTMLRGRPFSQYQYSKNWPASSSTLRSSQQGMRQMPENKQSVIVKIQSLSLSISKGSMKSIMMLSPWLSGTSKGCKGPGGWVVQDLFCWQSIHPGIYEVSRFFHIFS